MSPTVSAFYGDTGMAGLTQRHEVGGIVRSTPGERQDEVYFLG